MKLLKISIFFLVLNFSALAIGSWLMNNGPMTNWYVNLNQAPWTPPGWVFGIAWTTIMICFSVYMAYLFIEISNSSLILLYLTQLVLNISWNYIFFNQKLILFALVIITLLTAVISYLFITYYKEQKKVSFLLLPYMTWLCIATSLNLYIIIHN